MKIVEANGARIPALGLGTWDLRGGQCAELVAHALTHGYQHIDTAQMYANEREVGQGIAASGVTRDAFFLTTKIWPDNFSADDFARAAEERVRLLDCGPVDLLLLHWPSREVPLAETMAALVKAKRDGLTKHIGISNFTTALIGEAVALADEPIACNQVEYHPLLSQDAVLAACARHGIAVTAYCPIARNAVADQAVVREIAGKHDASPAQIALAWLVRQDGVIAIPRSSKPERLDSNLAALDIDLSDDDAAAIGALTAHNQRLVSPAGVAPDWD